MKLFDRYILLIFFSSCLYIILFSGLFAYYFLFYSQYFNQPSSEWYVYYEKGIMPDKFKILSSGFRDYKYIIASILISFLFVLLYHFAMRKFSFKNQFVSFLIYTLASMLILSGFYAAYLIIFHKLLNAFEMDYLKMELILFGLFSIFPSILNSIVYNRINNRVLVS